MTLLDPEEHRALLANAGYSEVQIFEEHSKGWICAMGSQSVIRKKTQFTSPVC